MYLLTVGADIKCFATNYDEHKQIMLNLNRARALLFKEV